MPHAKPLITITRGLPGNPAALFPASVSLRIAPDEPPLGRDGLLEFIAGSSAIVCMFNNTVDAAFLDAAGPRLKAVCTFAVGTDNIDLALCKSRGVMVCSTPDAVTEGTANLAFGLLLAVSRKIVEADRFVRTGEFAKLGNGFPKGWAGMHLAGQTLLIVGAGRIGRAVATRAQAFGMSIMYVARSRHIDFEIAPLMARRITLEAGLKLADVVSLHTPLVPETKHLLNASNLKLLKPTAIVINTARGPVIDEAALADVLFAGEIWGAGLDVFEHEPAVHPILCTLDNVVMTPHIGSSEKKYRELMTEMVCQSALAAVQGTDVPFRVL